MNAGQVVLPTSVNVDKHMCEQALCSRTDYIQFTTRSSSLPPRQTGLASVGAGRSLQAYSIALLSHWVRSRPVSTALSLLPFYHVRQAGLASVGA